jgi:long-chain fatty acid transport protein
MSMRVFLVEIVFLVLVAAAVRPASASKLNQEDGIMPNHSAEYVRTLNRNASTDADAAFYNPAGLSFLSKNGLYAMFSGQTYHAEKSQSLNIKAVRFKQGGNDTGFIATETFADLSGLPREYGTKTTAPISPDLNIIYKRDNIAFYFNFAIMQASPGATFKDGLAILDIGTFGTPLSLAPTSDPSSPNFKISNVSRNAMARRTEYYIGGTLGTSYKILDRLSAAIAYRYIYAKGNQRIIINNVSFDYIDATTSATYTTVDSNDPSNPYITDTLVMSNWDIDVDTKGQGHGIILGTDFKPTKEINIGIRYEYYFPMVLKKKTNKLLVNNWPNASVTSGARVESTGQLDIFKDGKSSPSAGQSAYFNNFNGTDKLKVTYPQTISLGISYNITNELRIEPSLDISLRPYRDLQGREKDWNIGYRGGACIEYTIFTDILTIKVSAGYSYNDFGIKPDKRTDSDPLLKSHTIGTGASFELNPDLTLTVGFFYMIFVKEHLTEYQNTIVPITDPDSETTYLKDMTFDERRWSFGWGATYRLNI